MKFLGSFFSYIIYYKILIEFLKWISKHTNDDAILTLQKYYNEILILQKPF